jgi:zinc/manganese transport system substrate-binding protein
MKIKTVCVLSVVSLLAAMAGQAGAAEKLKILTSFLPIYAHTKSITGDLAEVQMFIDKDADPHDYEFKPSDIKKVVSANLFVANGAGLEIWLKGLLEKSGNPKLVVVNASEGVSLMDNSKEFFKGSAAEEEEADDGSNKNLHVWLDPVLAQTQVKNILAALVKADPVNAAAYKKNAEAYLAKLRQLDESYRTAMDKLSNKNLVTFHDAFPYLAKRYGFDYLGCIAQFPEQDPKPAELKALVQLIRKNRVKVIFAENGYSPKLLSEVAKQTGATVSEVDTLEIGEPEANAYLVRMRNNLAAFEKAWKR